MKKEFSIVLLFHMTALLFMSARSILTCILDNFLAHFLSFFVKTARDSKILDENCDFLSF